MACFFILSTLGSERYRNVGAKPLRENVKRERWFEGMHAGADPGGDAENAGLYGTAFYFKNPTPPGAAQAT